VSRLAIVRETFTYFIPIGDDERVEDSPDYLQDIRDAESIGINASEREIDLEHRIDVLGERNDDA